MDVQAVVDVQALTLPARSLQHNLLAHAITQTVDRHHTINETQKSHSLQQHVQLFLRQIQEVMHVSEALVLQQGS